MVRGHSFRSGKGPRGFTLVELLMAASCTAIVAASSTTLVFAIAQASRETKEVRSAKSTGNYAVSRINRTIREARSIGTVTSSAVSLWVDDIKDDDRISLYEIGMIRYDADSDQIQYLQMTNPGGVIPTVPVTLADFQNVEALATKMVGPNLETQVWATDISEFEFSGYPSNTDTRLIDVRLVIEMTNESLVFKGAATPKASGEYLFVDGAIGEASAASGRLRRLVPAKWEGLADLRALQVGPPTVITGVGQMPAQ